MTSHQDGLSYRGRRMLALSKGKENIDDFGGEIKIITIRNVVRGTVITCNENNLSDYLETFE